MGRMLFALLLAISIHTAMLFVKIDFAFKSEISSKPEPIKITMSYRSIKKETKNPKPQMIKSSIKPDVIKSNVIKSEVKKPNPPPVADQKPVPIKTKPVKPAKTNSLIKTVKKSASKIEKKIVTKIEPEVEVTKVKKQNIKKVLKQEQAPVNVAVPFEKKKEKTVSITHTQAMPKYKTNPKLVYPRIAKKRGYQGIVLLSVVVSRTGIAKSVFVSKSSGYKMLDKAASKAVSKWQFYPGTEDGKKKEMSVEVPVRFALD